MNKGGRPRKQRKYITRSLSLSPETNAVLDKAYETQAPNGISLSQYVDLLLQHSRDFRNVIADNDIQALLEAQDANQRK